MSSVAIVCDSTADLPHSLTERFELGVVPLVLNWDGQTYRDKLDLPTSEFYRRLRTSKSLPKTGAPSLAAFERVYREQLRGHDAVVVLTLAASLSGTYEVARRAAATVAPEQIHVVDSGSVSICMAWLVEQAAQLAAQGQTAAEIVQQVEQTKPRLRILALVDTLEFLQRGGRIGRAAALAGTLLSVKPILSVRDGAVAPLERVRTMHGALRRMVELVAGMGPVQRLGVMDGDAATNAEHVLAQLHARYPDLAIDRGELGPVVGTHAGPGVVGVGALLAG